MDLAFLIENPELLDDLDAELEKLVESLTQTTRVVDSALAPAARGNASASLSAPAPDFAAAPSVGRKVRPRPATARPRLALA